MSSLTVRKVDDEVKRRLRIRAALRGRSLEAEVRSILQAAAFDSDEQTEGGKGLGAAIHDIFAPLGGVELELPARQSGRWPPDFDDPSFDPT